MIHRFGERGRFAIEIGDVLHGGPTTGLRVVDVWGADRHLSCDDNAAYVPQLCASLEGTVRWLQTNRDRGLPHPDLSPAENHRRLVAAAEDGAEHQRYRFMDWGPTTDNVTALLFRRGDSAVVTFEFWRAAHPRPDEVGQVFVVELPARALIDCLREAAQTLRSGV